MSQSEGDTCLDENAGKTHTPHLPALYPPPPHELQDPQIPSASSSLHFSFPLSLLFTSKGNPNQQVKRPIYSAHMTHGLGVLGNK